MATKKKTAKPAKKTTAAAKTKPAAARAPKKAPSAPAAAPAARVATTVAKVPVQSRKPKEKEVVIPAKSVTPPSKAAYNKTELEFFRKIILEKKKEIHEELETLRDTMMDSQTGEYVSENSTYSTHMEQGTDAMEREKMFLFASREGKFLNYLEDALKRIDKGTYGHCTECGKLIEKERLEAVPHAQQCLACKLKRGK